MNKMFLLVLFTAISFEPLAQAATSSKCPGEEGYNFTNYKHRNPQAGGFVSHMADVEDNDTVFIAPTAAVCGSSSIRGNARIYGNAVIDNSEVYGNARVYGNAKVSNNSEIYEDARVFDEAIVNQSRVFGNSTVEGWFKANGETFSSGQHKAPQFSKEELDAAEAQRRAEEQRRLNGQRLLEKNTILRDKLFTIIDKNYVISNYYSLNYLEVIKSSNPCILEFNEGGKLNLSLKKYIKKGIHTSKYIDDFSNSQFKENYVLNNPLPSKYHFIKNTSFGSGYNSYVPQVVIGNTDVITNADFSEVGESNFVYNPQQLSFLFVKTSARDEFYNAFNELYNSCPSN